MKLPAIQLYPGDWLRDEVAGCSLGAQGLWLRMMFIAHDSERYGYLCLNGNAMPDDFIARRCGSSVTDYVSLLAELDRAGIPSRTPEGIIFSRRMVRDAKARAANALRQKKFRDTHSNGGSNGTVTPPSRRSSISFSSSPSGKKPPTPKADEFPPIPESLRTPEFLAAWDDWLKDRAKRRKPVTPTAAKLQFARCEAWGPARAVAAIHVSIMHAWSGIFEEKSSGERHETPDQYADRLARK